MTVLSVLEERDTTLWRYMSKKPDPDSDLGSSMEGPSKQRYDRSVGSNHAKRNGV